MRRFLLFVSCIAILAALVTLGLTMRTEPESAATPAATPAAVPRVRPTPPLVEDAAITATLPEAPAVALALPNTPLAYRDLLKAQDAWFDQHVVACSRAAAGTATWLKLGEPWMLRAWHFILNRPLRESNETLVSEGRALLAAGCQDGAVLALLGLIHPEYPVSIGHLSAALPKLREGRWSPILLAIVQLKLSKQLENRFEVWKPLQMP
jgi:hypothetical protein